MDSPHSIWLVKGKEHHFTAQSRAQSAQKHSLLFPRGSVGYTLQPRKPNGAKGCRAASGLARSCGFGAPKINQ